jgi:sec-independent protein translocase protein TatA
MNAPALMMPGPTEWLLILAIVLVLFGAKKLPELARGLGQGLNEFRKARDDFDRALQSADAPARPSATPAGTPRDAAAAVPAARDGAGRPEHYAGRVDGSDLPAPHDGRGP